MVKAPTVLGIVRAQIPPSLLRRESACLSKAFNIKSEREDVEDNIPTDL
jgi:hypothetical protein